MEGYLLLRCSPTSAPQHADGAGGQKDDTDVNKREPGVVDQLDDGVFGELTGFAVVAMLRRGSGMVAATQRLVSRFSTIYSWEMLPAQTHPVRSTPGTGLRALMRAAGEASGIWISR